jgi:hypothetical protein
MITAIAVMETPTDLDAPKHSVRAGYSDIARQRQLESASQRPSVDRAEYWFVDPVVSPCDASQASVQMMAHAVHFRVEQISDVIP